MGKLIKNPDDFLSIKKVFGAIKSGKIPLDGLTSQELLGVDLNKGYGANRKTLFHHACQRNSRAELDSNTKELVKKLLCYGADPLLLHRDKNTMKDSLSLLVSGYNIESAKYLLEYCATNQLNIQSLKQNEHHVHQNSDMSHYKKEKLPIESVLHVATLNHDIEMLKLLIDYDADPNFTEPIWGIPLWLVAGSDKTSAKPCFQFLFDLTDNQHKLELRYGLHQTTILQKAGGVAYQVQMLQAAQDAEQLEFSAHVCNVIANLDAEEMPPLIYFPPNQEPSEAFLGVCEQEEIESNL